jgi:hypothetical protein
MPSGRFRHDRAGGRLADAVAKDRADAVDRAPAADELAGPLTPTTVRSLQSSHGNQFVARLVAGARPEAGSALMRNGFWGALDYLNPRYYVPTAVGGYTQQDLQGFQNPDPPFGVEDFPAEAELAFKRAFKIVASAAQKQRPDHLTRQEYDQTARLLGDIWDRATRLVLSTTLEDETAMEAGAADARKLDLATETLKDVIELARTETGRDLLTTVARAANTAPKVYISANELVIAPAANPRSRNLPASQAQVSDVVYTPTAYKTGKARNSAENLRQLEAAKRNNPWVTPHRSDITLYHELVHAFHTQTAVGKEKDALVGRDRDAGVLIDPVDPVDAPYAGTGFDEGTTKGVSLEEYATVGLGQYAQDRFTENRYRRERRALGENVPARGYYTDKDTRGQRVGS